jgi:hypothetical protein
VNLPENRALAVVLYAFDRVEVPVQQALLRTAANTVLRDEAKEAARVREGATCPGAMCEPCTFGPANRPGYAGAGPGNGNALIIRPLPSLPRLSP